MLEKNTPHEWIAYVGPFSFPWGQAGSRRMCGIARSLSDAGFFIIVAGGDKIPASLTDLGEGEVGGSIRHIGLGESPQKNSSIYKKFIQVFFNWGKKTVDWLDSQENQPSHVIVYGGSAQYILRLLPWCRKHGIPLIVDVVEWYDPKQLAGGTFGPFNISAKLALHYLYPKCNGVIAISQLLEEHYKSGTCSVIRVPPTIDVFGINQRKINSENETSKLTLVYAGTPGKKDLLGNVIKAVAIVDPLGVRLKLKVLGPTQDQVKVLLGNTDIPACVDILGRVTQSDVSNYVMSADFSVLLREPLRFANAGFPTKFVESMANGTPVIANLTSDLGLYLRDGIEGLVCNDYSVDSLAFTLQRALLLSPAELTKMREAARDQAARSFDFRVHALPLSHFIKNLKK